jgi:alpha-L-rhamnosidase
LPKVALAGYGEHTVDFASTDLAGNTEIVRRTVVSVDDQNVAKAPSRTTLSVSKRHLRRSGRVTVRTQVLALGAGVTGKVVVRMDGKVLRTVSLSGGRASITFRIDKRGTHKITVRYLGSPSVAPSVSPSRTVRVR